MSFKTSQLNMIQRAYTRTGHPVKLWMPHRWKRSRPGWMALWAAWSSDRCPCPWQGG